jgi:hypothetical protein
MKITQDELKSLYRSHIQRRVPPSRAECPPPEIIFQAFEPSTPSSEKAKIVDHMAGCSHCFQEFELWLHFSRGQEDALKSIINWIKKEDKPAITQNKKNKLLELALGPRGQSLPLWKWAIGLIITVAFAGLVVLGVKNTFINAGLEERGRWPGQIRLLFPVQGQKVRVPFTFQWEAMPNAEYYSLEIFDRTLLPLWKSPRIEARQYELPPEAQQFIIKEKVCFWTITAWLNDGTKRESLLGEFATE